MAEINRDDILTEEAIQAPLVLAKNLDILALSIDKVIAAGKASEVVLKNGAGATEARAETEKLTLAQGELIKIQKQVEVAQARDNAEYQKYVKTLTDVKNATKEKTVLQEQDSKSVDAQTNSIKQLEAALKKNRDLYKDMGSEQQRASTEGKELLKVIQTQDKQVKELNGTIGKHTDKVGDYKGQLQTLFPAQAAFVTGMMNMVKAGLAFIATPVGLAVAGLLAGFALLKNEINNNDAAADEYERRLAQLNATLNIMKRNVGLVTLALTGNHAALMQLLGLSKNAGDEAKKLTAEQQALEDATNRLTLREGNLINQRDKLILQSKNKKITDEQAIELNRKAAEIDALLTDTQIKLATKKAEVTVKQVGLEFGIQQKLNESLAEYGDRIIENSQVSGEKGKIVADAINGIAEAQNKSIKLQEKLDNQQDAREQKIAARREKNAADAKKEAEEEEAWKQRVEKAESERFIEDQKRKQKEQDDIKARDERGLKSMEATQKAMAAKQAAFDKQSMINKQKVVDFEFKLTNLRLSIAATYVNTAGQLIAQNIADENTAKDVKKAVAVVEIGINLERELAANALGAAKIVAELGGLVGAPIAASYLALSNGLAIARAIGAGVAVLAFKRGTSYSPEGPALVGEEGSEFIQSPDGKMSLSPNRATLVNLAKGSKVFTHSETMKMIALAGMNQEGSVNNENFLLYHKIGELQNTIEEQDERIVRAVENSSGKVVQQGSNLYHHHRKLDGSTKITRLKSMTR